jgi:hypothetical protein
MAPLLLSPPRPVFPRVGDRVRWHERDIVHTGTYLGHRYVREERQDCCRPIVRSEVLGQEVSVDSFDVIRLEDPAASLGPNWNRLPEAGTLLQPDASQTSQLRALLNRVTPPGPTYSQFLSEIWHRGYEAYVVGGTVRDVVAQRPSKDVDVVTTMPLPSLVSLAISMYGIKPSAHLLRGYLRIGGSNRSGAPIIDVKVFSKSGVGTPNALFGTEFNEDVAQRDFACNSLYYGPMNNILVDPTGRGISDAASSLLHLVCNISLKSKPERAEIAIRCFKFLARGFKCTQDCIDCIRTDFIPGFPALTPTNVVDYIGRQVLRKAIPRDRPTVLRKFRQVMEENGCASTYETYIFPREEELLR